MKFPDEKRMYVLVRKELDETYRAVQGAHALAQYSIDHFNNFTIWDNECLIFLGVRFPLGLKLEKVRLIEIGIDFSVFYEPDINQETAIACWTYPEVFKHLSLA